MDNSHMFRITLVLIFSYFELLAAPLPGAAHPELSKLSKVFSSPWGFTIDGTKSSWFKKSANLDASPFLLTYFVPNDPNSFAKLSVRIDDLKNFPSKDPNIKKYTSYYTKQFPKFGFELMRLPKVYESKNIAIVDSIDLKKDYQIRQYIFWNKKRAVIIGCSDKSVSFHENWKECDHLARGFRWNR